MNKLKQLLVLSIITALSFISPLTAFAEPVDPLLLQESTEPTLNMTELTLPAKLIVDGTTTVAFTWLRVTGTTKDVKWSISDKSVARLVKVNTKNMIQVDAKKKGKATITAKVGNKKLKCKLTVKNKISDEQLSDLIKVDMTNAPKQYVTFTNTSPYHVIFDGHTHYYDADNKIIESSTIGWVYLKPGETRKEYAPTDMYPGTDHWDFAFESTGIDYEYRPLSTTTEIKGIDNNILSVEVTNVSDYTEGSYDVALFFMKNGEVVWADERTTKETMTPGKSEILTYNISSVPEYDEIVVDPER